MIFTAFIRFWVGRGFIVGYLALAFLSTMVYADQYPNPEEEKALRVEWQHLQSSHVAIKDERYAILLVKVIQRHLTTWAKEIVQAGAPVTIVVEVGANTPHTALEEAMLLQTPDPGLIDALLKHGANPNQTMGADDEPATALMLAVAADSLPIVQRLVQAGAKLNTLVAGETDGAWEGNTPLYHAKPNTPIYNYLIQQGAARMPGRCWGYVDDPDPKGLNVRMAPALDAKCTTTLAYGILVHIRSAQNGWLAVDWEGSYGQGWVWAKKIRAPEAGPKISSLALDDQRYYENLSDLFNDLHTPVPSESSEPVTHVKMKKIVYPAHYLGCYGAWALLLEGDGVQRYRNIYIVD